MLILLLGSGTLGAAALRLWASRRPRVALDGLEVAFFSAVTALVAIGWIAVVLASLGLFSLPWVGGGAGMIGVAILVACRHERRRALAPLGLAGRTFLVVLAASAVFYARPHEYVLGGADAGTYVNVASTIARTGGLVLRDDWVALAALHGDVSLRPSPRTQLTRQIQFVGWYVDDGDASRILPQFLPLHPSLLAIAIAAGGLRAALYVPPACAILGLMGVFLLARRLFGGTAGLLAATILAASPAQIFFARYPTAEPLSFALVFAGLLAYQHLRDGEGDSRVLGALGGSAIGSAALARIDVPLVVALFAGALLAEARAKRWGRGWTVFGVALAALLVHAALHAWSFAWPYVWNVYEEPARRVASIVEGHPWMAAGLAASLAAGAWFFVSLLLSPASGLSEKWRQRARDAAAGAVVLVSLYGYFVRPWLGPRGTATTWPSGVSYPLLDAENWVRVGWYLTPLGIALATVGLATVIRSGDLSRAWLFVAAGSLTTLHFVVRIMTTPYHIYAMRRFVPIALPALAVFAAVAVVTLARSRRVPGARILAAALAMVLLAGLVERSLDIARHRDLPGAIDWIHTLASRLRPDAVIVFAEPHKALLADTFGPPLRYVFGHPVVPVRQPIAPAVPLVRDVLARAAREGRPVQLLATESIPPVVRQAFRLEPVGTVPVHLSMLMNTYEGFPRTRQTVDYGIEIYDLLPAEVGREDGAGREAFIDVGTLDATTLRGGFHTKEQLGDGISGRWTDGDAALEIAMAAPSLVDLAIRARVFDGEGRAIPLVHVTLDDQVVGAFRPETEWRTFRFSARSRPFEGMTRLRLRTTPFVPARLGRSSDQRELGVFVDWVRLTPR